MDPSTAQWTWPDDVPSASSASDHDGQSPNHNESQHTEPHQRRADFESQPQPQPRQRHYGPRSCRICLEECNPTWPSTGNTSTLVGMMGSGAKPVYMSADGLGRLISPCKCKGSQKYVHEGCLRAWRTADQTRQSANFFTCPTCKYQYKLSRLSWGTRLQSGTAQISLTAFVFVFSVFLLGFVADPIFNLWADPVGTIAETVVGSFDDFGRPPEPVHVPGDGTWYEHFVKGFLSLGIVGFLKYLIAMSPWQWWNMRASGIMGGGGRRGGGGRNRSEGISWALVMIGAMTFIYTVWKAVNSLSHTVLQRAGDSVLDVGNEDDDED
ncbi:hypothetical protein D7B24_002161 [Verticillium nonalfalfae]|uniref:RING-CH-type domain-containing protein n=1 Tax=Verticillium nonalfalfae TaxID=1051616 RepID=A0A3M9YI09_9PEZI|nr:uncharacterized protein D7B24_002161 [Verticillium nonalfalfae]RNJ59552.1 hypothetical protein D7B24_002161 [Verticillium nonalfalfae]